MSVQLRGRLAARGDEPLGEACGIERAMAVVGNRVAMLLMREAFHGASRFESLCRRVGASEAQVAQHLKRLVAAGLLTKEPYREPGQRTRSAYVLTDAGHDLLPAVMALLDWAGEHVPTSYGATVLTHAGCGAAAHVEIRCEAGHRVREDELVIEGPDLHPAPTDRAPTPDSDQH
ncbi:helix-turn-helix domain-containing protein [Raineyella sp. LH-20]|uniref:winged helix-turn-helix transcriptional regulator n=1 Tax=Raineyella sp. LH-20 TaxID=3081204 RepID=UPI0029540857|nr:helix-turn-helix domain-containing protein [Raineyella sp. LH-20]WOP18800.1 helix-turn-helix domain-containing protein [Raineyella sp. LH-20]